MTGPASLKEWATGRQAELIDAVEKHGSARAAAAALGLHHSYIGKAMKAVRAKAALAGHSPQHDMTHTVPDGFTVRGVSTYYDKEGQKHYTTEVHVDQCAASRERAVIDSPRCRCQAPAEIGAVRERQHPARHRHRRDFGR